MALSVPPRSQLRVYLSLFAVSLAVRAATAASLTNAGILDAYYYFHVARNTAAGRGLVEDVVWNYLDGSAAALTLPHPSNLYWPPLTNLLASSGILLFGRVLSDWRGAQVPFVLLSALVPPLAAALSEHLWKRRAATIQAGLLTLFTATYFQRWVIPESCTPFCLSVGVCFLALARGTGAHPAWLGLAGAAVAVSQLTRADGILLLPIALAAAWLRPSRAGALASACFLGGAYSLVLAPWLVRNVSVVGTAFPGGGLTSLWLRAYEDIFAFQTPLTAARSFAFGVPASLVPRAGGVLENLGDALLVFQVILPPLAVVGYLRARASAAAPLLWPVTVYLVALTVLTGFFFPFTSHYGTYFRSLSALVPWTMALVPGGVEAFAEWYARTLKRDRDDMVGFYGRAVVIVAVAATVRYQIHEVGLGAWGGAAEPWNRRLDHYVEVGDYLRARGEKGPVLTVMPPGFAVATGLSSAVVPSDGDEAIVAAATRFGARFVLFETNGPSWHGARGSDGSALPPPGWRAVRSFRDCLGGPVLLFESGARPAERGKPE